MNQSNKINLDYTDEITDKKPTSKQLEVLKLLNPFVKKTNYSEVAKILGISKAGVQQRMCRLKKRCPGIYWKFRQLRKDMTAGQIAINNSVPISHLCTDSKQNECFDYIKVKEIF